MLTYMTSLVPIQAHYELWNYGVIARGVFTECILQIIIAYLIRDVRVAFIWMRAWVAQGRRRRLLLLLAPLRRGLARCSLRPAWSFTV